MFNQLFKRPQAMARHQNGPLAEERRRYLAHCAKQQMSLETLGQIARNTLIVATILRLADRPRDRITRTEIAAEADRWVNRRSRPRQVLNVRLECRKLRGHAIRWLTFLGRLQPPVTVQQPYAEHVARFTDYLLRERGLSPRTIAYSGQVIQEFLAQIDEANLLLKTLTVVQVNELLAKKVQKNGFARVTVKRCAAALRPFLRYAEACEWCRPGLADAVRTPRVYSHTGLPLGPSWDDVNRLLAAAHGNQSVDIRDRAMLLLLSVYGLRAGEVVALRLEDFDWEREVLIVPYGKRQRPRTYPLCRPVGDAVVRYLREVRPRSDRRQIFITLLAPFRPLDGATVGGMVSRRLHALGLTLPHYGAHVLRHACARHLLARGLSLKEIGDHLGHQSVEATRIYAKVDLASLRIVGDFDLEGLQ
jgi:site-specific recombinase XerD